MLHPGQNQGEHSRRDYSVLQIWYFKKSHTNVFSLVFCVCYSVVRRSLIRNRCSPRNIFVLREGQLWWFLYHFSSLWRSIFVRVNDEVLRTRIGKVPTEVINCYFLSWNHSANMQTKLIYTILTVICWIRDYVTTAWLCSHNCQGNCKENNQVEKSI